MMTGEWFLAFLHLWMVIPVLVTCMIHVCQDCPFPSKQMSRFVYNFLSFTYSTCLPINFHIIYSLCVLSPHIFIPVGFVRYFFMCLLHFLLYHLHSKSLFFIFPTLLFPYSFPIFSLLIYYLLPTYNFPMFSLLCHCSHILSLLFPLGVHGFSLKVVYP